jgi:hypothetical protein
MVLQHCAVPAGRGRRHPGAARSRARQRERARAVRSPDSTMTCLLIGSSLRQQGGKGESQLVPEQDARRVGQGLRRPPALPGQGIARCPVRASEHQVSAAGIGWQQPGGKRVAGHRQAADDMPRVDSAAPGHIQGAPGHPDMAGRGSPKAAATKDGADIDDPESTAQSRKKERIRSPRLVLNIATTSRRSGLSS